MKPYKTIKLIDSPDVADIQADGRKSSVGNLRGKGGDYRGIQKSRKKRASRRYLKRSDKARVDRQLQNDEE